MALRFDPAALMAPGGVVSGLDNMGAAVMNALNRRSERKAASEAEARRRQQMREDAALRRSQDVEDRDLRIKTTREEADLANTRATEKAFNENWRNETRDIKDREFKASESEKDRTSREGIATQRATAGAARSAGLRALTKLDKADIEGAYMAAGLAADGSNIGPGGIVGPPRPEQAAKFDAEIAMRRKAKNIPGDYDRAGVSAVLSEGGEAPGAAAAAAPAPGGAPAAAAPATGVVAEDPATVSARDQLLASLDASIQAAGANATSTQRSNYTRLRAQAEGIKTTADLEAFKNQHGGRVKAQATAQAPGMSPQGMPIPTAEELAQSGFGPAGQPRGMSQQGLLVPEQDAIAQAQLAADPNARAARFNADLAGALPPAAADDRMSPQGMPIPTADDLAQSGFGPSGQPLEMAAPIPTADDLARSGFDPAGVPPAVSQGPTPAELALAGFGPTGQPLGMSQQGLPVPESDAMAQAQLAADPNARAARFNAAMMPMPMTLAEALQQRRLMPLRRPQQQYRVTGQPAGMPIPNL